MQKRLEPYLCVQQCKDLKEVLETMARDITLTSQTCVNLKQYKIAPPGVTMSGAWINLTLGNAAKLCTDCGKELAGCGFVIKEAKKKLEGN